MDTIFRAHLDPVEHDGGLVLDGAMVLDGALILDGALVLNGEVELDAKFTRVARLDGVERDGAIKLHHSPEIQAYSECVLYSS